MFVIHINSSYFFVLRLIVFSWITSAFQQIHPNNWRFLSVCFCKTVLLYFDLIHVPVSCCELVVLTQDRFNDSK